MTETTGEMTDTAGQERPARTERASERLHKEADRRWKKVEQEHPELADTVAFGRGLVNLYIDELPAAGRIALTPEAARAKLAAGQPLLEDEQLDLDLPGVRRFFSSLCSWAGDQPDLARDAWAVKGAVRKGTLDVDDLIGAALDGDQARIDGVAARLGVQPTLIQTLTGFAVSAALMETARTLAPTLEEAGAAWEEGFCPICGGPPLLAELQGSEGQRVLRCAACGGGWKFPRVQCPHCGTTDAAKLHYLALDEEAEKYRVELCDNCHGFIKSVTSFAPTPAELLTIEDAAMLHLDAAARERGYTPAPEAEGDEAEGRAAEGEGRADGVQAEGGGR